MAPEIARRCGQVVPAPLCLSLVVVVLAALASLGLGQTANLDSDEYSWELSSPGAGESVEFLANSERPSQAGAWRTSVGLGREGASSRRVSGARARRFTTSGDHNKSLLAPTDSTVPSGGGDDDYEHDDDGVGQTVHVPLTAIHVDRAEFPLSKLLFKLTLRLALSEAVARLQSTEFAPTTPTTPTTAKTATTATTASATAATSTRPATAKRRTQRRGRGRRRVKLSLSARSANTCSRQYAAALAAEEFYVRGSRLFIVSGCDDAIRAVSRLASNWRVPIMTAAGFGADLNDKAVHTTLVRVAFSLRAAVEFLFKVMRSFQWRRVNLVVDESDANSLALRGSIEEFVARQTRQAADFQVKLNTIAFDLRSLMAGSAGPGEAAAAAANNATALEAASWDEQNVAAKAASEARMRAELLEADDDKWPSELARKVIEDTLWQCSMFSRVTVVLMPQHLIRRFMLSAYDQNMANGMYTFINLPLLMQSRADTEPPTGGADQPVATSSQSSAQSLAAVGNRAQLQQEQSQQPQQPLQPQQQSFPATTGENAFIWRSMKSRARNAHAKQAFESLMSIYLRTPTTKAYVYFASRLNNLANSLYTATRGGPLGATVAPPGGGHSTNSSAAIRSTAPRRIQLDINPYSASFYDAVQIYAMALNESLGQSAGPPAGNDSLVSVHARISDLVRSRRFDNMVTGHIYINQNGDRETDYTLDDMNQMTGKFAPVILYRGETRDIERLARIHWSSDPTVGPTSDVADCVLLGSCVSKPMTRFTLVLLLLAAPLLVILTGAFFFVHNKLSLESQLVDYWWRIHLSELEIVPTRRKRANDGSLVMATTGGQPGSLASESHCHTSSRVLTEKSAPRLAITSGQRRSGASSIVSGAGNRTEITKATDTSAGWTSSAADACYGNITLAIYKLSKVALKPISKFHQSRKLMVELRSLKELSHNNLCRFVGILIDEGNLALVTEFCAKGSLREFFHSESMVIDWTFKCSIINDILAGLQYIHSSALVYHGRLKSSNCLVSARFVVKLADYGPHSFYEQLDDEAASAVAAAAASSASQGSTGDEARDEWLKARLWLAPEHLRSSSRSAGSPRGDVYSLGLLLYEVLSSNLPFYDAHKADFVRPLAEMHQTIKANGPAELMAPLVSALDTDEAADVGPLVALMESCWRFEPAKRPSSQAVSAALRRITRGVTSKKLLENLTSRMEQYTNNLESLVEAKLATLMEEKLKTEELLYQFVPKSIASLLREGQFVEPEAFECVTVFYSDIVGFTSLSSQSSPMEVVSFLSDLYLCFDSTLEQHDIFKVDTIGDAYIVASGLPQRNEGKHVVEIACAALELRDRLKQFRIPHRPEHSLEMRVGIHSGACIAGIVGGLNMPKYCVFGDTLTTGKFMESSGLPMKIHITDESRRLLQGASDFSIEPRTPRITRDGLPFQTYWLEKATAYPAA